MLAGAALLAATGCGRREAPAEAAPDFEVHDVAGRPLRLSELKGKVVLLDFWATWCAPCEESLPHLKALDARYRPKGLDVVGISVDDEPRDVPPFLKSHGVAYRVAVDADKRIMDEYDVSNIPTTVLVGRDGKIRGRWMGAGEDIDRDIDAAVKDALAEDK